MTTPIPPSKMFPSGNAKYLVDIFVPNHSRGLMVDALVLKNTIGEDKARIVTIPFRACSESIDANDKNLDCQQEADIAVFVERLFEHSSLRLYKRRVLLSNPEWLTDRDLQIAKCMITELWHKTRFGMETLANILPEKTHTYIGFTSLAIPGTVSDYNSCLHFAGKSRIRHTQQVIDIWLADQSLPPLALQSYGGDLNIPKWFKSGNIDLFLGFLEQTDLNLSLVKHGIHVCTSQMEGFGHYINEARSIAALTITLDAPPMNELIDSDCGIVIPARKSFFHHCGVGFTADQDAIKSGILKALDMPDGTRRALGQKARDRFLEEQGEFAQRLRLAISDTVSLHLQPNRYTELNTDRRQRQQIFTGIYYNNSWGKPNDPTKSPFYSGSGSHESSIVSAYIESIHGFLKTLKKKPNVIDYGCGDFAVGSQIRPLCDTYIACDIVPELIEFNRTRYKENNVDFRIIDLVSDPLPRTEIAFVRQVLQHLSNCEIELILTKIRASCEYLILTEHLPTNPDFPRNLDKPAGPNIRLELGSGVIVTDPPFNLSNVEEHILCEVNEFGGIIRTTLYRLK